MDSIGIETAKGGVVKSIDDANKIYVLASVDGEDISFVVYN